MFIAKYNNFKETWSSDFCYHHYIDQNNLLQPNKSQKNYRLCIKIQFLFLFYNITKIINLWRKMLMSAELNRCAM